MAESKNLYSIASKAARSIGDYESKKIGIRESLRDIDLEKKYLDLTLNKISATTDTLQKGLELAETVAVGMTKTASFKESIPFAEEQLQKIHDSPDTKLEEVERSSFRKAMDYLSGTPSEYRFGDIKFSGKDDISDLKALGKYGKYKSMFDEMISETSNIENKDIIQNNEASKFDFSVNKNTNVPTIETIDDNSNNKINSYDEYVEKYGQPSNSIKAMLGMLPFPKEEDALDLNSMWDEAIWNEIGNYEDNNQSQPMKKYYIQQTGLHKRG
jgi:hypothetical protein